MANFTHLHVHTGYSLLDSSAKIPDLVARAKELGFDSLAITDHGVMYGCIEFYKECKKQGIKPIIGCEVYVAPQSRFDKTSGDEKERYYHLILLAESEVGYHNLAKIVTRGFTEGYYYKPRVDKEVLEKYHEGIICLSACMQGEVAFYLRRNLYDAAKKAAFSYLDIFGKENFFLEMQDHGYDEDQVVNQGMLRMHDETGIPLVCTNDSHYIKAEDWEAHDMLLCIQTNEKVSEENRMRYPGGQFYLKSEEEMRQLFSYAQEACDNTKKIADRCQIEFEFGNYKIPHYDYPKEFENSYAYLRHLVEEGIKMRYPEASEEITARMEMELHVIDSMGFVDYFLIVWDFINYARQHDIAVGPGRGSAAGSIVAYALQITNIEPLNLDLLFERFLNPERVTMPDIDVDIADVGRQQVIEYVSRKYGEECVVQIVTFGTLGARNVIRDVGRAMDMPYAICDAVAKSIPADPKITLEKAMEISPDFQKLYESSNEIKYLVDMATQLEGLPRHTSMHAAGVVIGSEPIENFVPLCKNGEAVCTQYEKGTVEELGLLKMDFLGLKTLSVIKNAVLSIEKRTGIKIDVEHLDESDPKVYEMISRGDCDGVFQLENSGMQDFMKRLRPQNIEDVIAGISLYRPGPMDFIPKYIEGKQNAEHVSYETPKLEPILKSTYGCIVYQEQVMQIVMELAGYSLGRADLMRRAISKKHEDELARERNNFVYGSEELGVPGCIKNGIPEDVANHIFDQMSDFASYAFNKSHAAAYAVVAYETAWLKCYYPEDFMASLMTSFKDNSAKLAKYIGSVKKMGIPMLPPDVNTGEGSFSVDNGGIRYGLSAIKSVGDALVDAVLTERDKNGKFVDLQDFATRLSGKEANKRSMESFILAGAFDCFPQNRRQMMMAYPDILDAANRERKEKISGQMSLMEFMGVTDTKKDPFKVQFADVEEFPKDVILQGEKEMLGLYVSGHPLDSMQEIMEACVTATASDFMFDADEASMDASYDESFQPERRGRVTEAEDGRVYTVGGIIVGIKPILTKKNENMAFITLEDLTGTVEVVVFARTYAKCRQYLTENNAIFVKGRAQISEKESKILAEEVIPMSKMAEEAEAANKKLWIQYPDEVSFQKAVYDLLNDLRRFPGRMQTSVYLKKEKIAKKIPATVAFSEECLNYLSSKYGEENVKVTEVSKGEKK